MTKGKDIAPDYSSGVRRMTPVIVTGWVLLTAVYAFLVYSFRQSETFLGFPKPADEFCVDKPEGECYRIDLFAFQVASGIALTTCGVLGFVAWHVNKRVFTILPPTAEGRLFGYLPEAELLAAINFMFQFWDFCISLAIPEHATVLMLSHHLMASTVSWCSIRYQYLHYYGIFFLGLTEVSSFFLAFVDLARFFPPVPGTLFQKWIDLVCGPCFVACFIYYRVILWWPESYRLYKDVQAVVKSGKAEQLRPGATWVLYLFLALNLPLGLLQLYWLTVIFEEAKKSLAT